MDHYQIIAENFQNTIETIAMSADELAATIERGSLLMAGALLADRKIIACGNGADAALAQLFVCNLLNRFEHDRPALPALSLSADSVSLTAIAQSGAYSEIFSRQLRALGQQGDVLLCINSGEGASNLMRAVQAAQDQMMGVVVMTNVSDHMLDAAIRPEDVEVRVNATRQATVVQMHTIAIHCICELLDHSLFGTHSQE